MARAEDCEHVAVGKANLGVGANVVEGLLVRRVEERVGDEADRALVDVVARLALNEHNLARHDRKSHVARLHLLLHKAPVRVLHNPKALNLLHGHAAKVRRLVASKRLLNVRLVAPRLCWETTRRRKTC